MIAMSYQGTGHVYLSLSKAIITSFFVQWQDLDLVENIDSSSMQLLPVVTDLFIGFGLFHFDLDIVQCDCTSFLCRSSCFSSFIVILSMNTLSTCDFVCVCVR